MKQLPPAKSRRGSVKRALVVALLTLLHIPGSVAAQEGSEADRGEAARATYGLEVDINSRYVFRGLAYSQGPVKQSTAWVTTAGFTVYAWSNFVLNRGPQRGEFSEIDFGISYAHEWKKMTLEPALDCYLYRPPAPPKDPPTGEASLKLSYPLGPARLFTRQTLDIGSYRGAYFGEAGLSYERKLNRKTTVATAFNLGWASAKFNEAYIGVPERALNVTGAEVSLTYAPSPRFYLRPHFEFSRIADGRLRERLDAPTIGNFGVALGFNLSGASSR